MLAYSYIRFSHGTQGKGDSKRRQVHASEKYCQRRGWTLDDSLKMEDLGVSAFKGQNLATGALAGFMAAIEAGRVKAGSAIIVESLDRLSRSGIDEGYDLFKKILKAGIIIVTLNPEREYNRESLKSLTGIIEPLIVLERANEESEMKSKRIAASWEKRRMMAKDRPMSSRCPAWLKWDGKKFMPIPHRVEVVKRIYQMVIEGDGVWGICKKLNEGGVAGFGVRAWDVDYVGKLLRKRQVLGEIQPKKRAGNGSRMQACEAVIGYYPQVIDTETYYRVQGILDSRKGFKGRNGKQIANMFSGLLFDSRDGCTMRVRRHCKKKVVVSTGGLRWEKGSSRMGFDYELLEAGFLNFVKSIKLDSPAKVDAGAELEAVKAQLAEVEGRLNKIQGLMEDPSQPLDTLASAASRLESSRKALKEKVERLAAEAENDPADDINQLQDMVDVLLKAEVDGNLETVRNKVRNKIRQVVSEIWLLMSSDSRFHRRAMVQVFFKQGGWRLIQIETISRGKNRGTSFAYGGQESGILIDLRRVKHHHHPIKSSG